MVTLNISFISSQHGRKNKSIKGATACLALLSILPDKMRKKEERRDSCESKAQRSWPHLGFTINSIKGARHIFITVSALITLYQSFNTSTKTKPDCVCGGMERVAEQRYSGSVRME